jgi:phosphatidylinositol alpha 1,6-mannosyltransferase
MRVLIATESFLPRSNGVTNSVLRSAHHLREAGNEVVILAPGKGPASVGDIRIERVPAISLNTVAQVDLALMRVKQMCGRLTDFAPDVIHLASPFLLGDQVRKAAQLLDVPTVAVYQTDVTGFASFYGLSAVSYLAERRVKKIHCNVDINLVPSTHSGKYLESLGARNISVWGRGVDLRQFNPAHRSTDLRKSWGADSETIVIGFAGRLAPEKKVENLRALRDIAQLTSRKIKVVIIGDGPSRERLQRTLPLAYFTGHLHGAELGIAIASLDLLISTGENETFCQVIQEGFASGLPVIAPATGGPVDLVIPGLNGFLYEPGSLQSLRMSALKIVSEREKISALGRNGQQMVQKRTWAALSDELIGHYERAIKMNQAKRNFEGAA